MHQSLALDDQLRDDGKVSGGRLEDLPFQPRVASHQFGNGGLVLLAAQGAMTAAWVWHGGDWLTIKHYNNTRACRERARVSCYSYLQSTIEAVAVPTLQEDQLPALAAALMRLRGDTLRSAGAVTGIRAANLSVWLRGKEQVISAKRVAGLIYHLGIEGGRLRNDVLHCWRDAGLLDDIQAVLGAVTDGGDAVWLFQDSQPGLTKVRFLRVDEAWVRVEISPGVGAVRDIAEVVSLRRVVTLATSLAAIPTEPLQEARNALLTLAEQAATDVGDDELLDRLMHLLPDDMGAELGANIASPQGWQQLETALRAALRNGVTPADIAALIAANYRNGGNAAHGRNQVST